MPDLEVGAVDRSLVDNHPGVGFLVPVRSTDPSVSDYPNVLCVSCGLEISD